MIHFEFSRRESGDLSGFDLGDITVVGPGGSHTSIGKTPDQSMMIYLSLAHLISGLCDVAVGRKPTFSFVATDSSYSLAITRKKNDKLMIAAKRSSLAEAPTSEVLSSLADGVQNFLSDPKNQLPPGDPAYEDLQEAIDRLKATLASIE